METTFKLENKTRLKTEEMAQKIFIEAVALWLSRVPQVPGITPLDLKKEAKRCATLYFDSSTE